MARRQGHAARASVDLTQGPIAGGIARFALPLLGTSVVQQLYNTVDLLFVGNVLGTEASAALGVSALLITCLVGFFTGLSVGVNVVVARFLGSGRVDDVDRAVHAAVTLGLAGGVALSVLGWLLAPWYVAVMGTPPGVVADAETYLRVYFVSMVSVVTYNMCAGVLRSLGDSATPLRAQLVGGLANVGMNALFLMACGLGIAGSALATLVSQSVAALLLVAHLVRVDAPWRLRARKLAIHGDILRPILSVGIPTGLQSTVVTLSNVIVQYQINQLGTTAMAAFTVYFKVELPIYYVIVSIGQAATTFVAQNCGARQWGRARTGTRLCLGAGVAVSAVLAAALLAAGYWAFWIFNQEPDVIAAGRSVIAVTFPFYWVYVFIEVFAASIRGRGQSVAPMVIVIANICVLRTLVVLLVSPLMPGVQGVAAAYPISWVTTAPCMAVCYRFVSRTLDDDLRE